MEPPRQRETAIAPPTSHASSALLPPIANRPPAPGSRSNSHGVRRRRGRSPNALVRIPIPRTPRGQDAFNGIGAHDGGGRHGGPAVRRLDHDAPPPDRRGCAPDAPRPNGPAAKRYSPGRRPTSDPAPPS